MAEIDAGDQIFLMQYVAIAYLILIAAFSYYTDIIDFVDAALVSAFLACVYFIWSIEKEGY